MSTKSRNNKTTTQKSFIGTPNIPVTLYQKQPESQILVKMLKLC